MKLYAKILTLAATAALFTAPTFAQGMFVKVDVPFTFHVANKAMPAGTYQVKYSPSNHFVLIQGEGGIGSAMIIGYSGTVINGPGDPAMMFRVYGTTRFFAGLRSTGSGNLKIAKCHLEDEMAKLEQGTETALVIVPRR